MGDDSDWLGAGSYLAFIMAISFNGFLDLWAGFFIASLCACFAYLPSHEAQHGNYSRGNPNLDGLMAWLAISLLLP